MNLCYLNILLFLVLQINAYMYIKKESSTGESNFFWATQFIGTGVVAGLLYYLCHLGKYIMATSLVVLSLLFLPLVTFFISTMIFGIEKREKIYLGK